MDSEQLKRIAPAVQSFNSKKLLVIGDIVLDEFMYTETERISREAPVFICKYLNSDFYPGCAGNTISNVLSLGGNPVPAGILGNDDDGRMVVKQFQTQGIDCSHLELKDSVSTMKKTRILAGGVHRAKQHMLRVDKEFDFNGLLKDKNLLNDITGFDGIIISDYNYNTITPGIAERLISEAVKNNVPVFLDSRYRADRFKGVTAITPNEEEAENILNSRIPDSGEGLKKALLSLCEKCDCENVLLTRGSNGLVVYNKKTEEMKQLSVYGSREAVDVSGAGDSVMAAFALSIVSGLSVFDAAYIANISGGISVMKKGTYSVKQQEIVEAVNG